MALLVLIVVVLIAGCGGPPAPPANLPTPHFGYNDDWAQKPDLLDEAAASGADTVRYNLAWSDVEPSPGMWDWSSYDDLYNQALDAGLHPLLILGNAPCWAYGEEPGCTSIPSHPPDAAHLADWATFAGMAAKRYPGARGLEVWNEPNLDRFWQGEPLDPEHYASMLVAAYRAIKEVDAAMPVVSAGLLPAGESAPGKIAYAEFLRRVLDDGGVDHLDAVGVHPYPFFTDDPVRRVATVMGDVRVVLATAGLRDTPIWVTEVGVSTTGPAPYSDAEQAAVLVGIYDLLAHTPNVPVVIIHRFTDIDGDPAGREPGYGVTTTDGEPKPAYCALGELRGAHPC